MKNVMPMFKYFSIIVFIGFLFWLGRNIIHNDIAELRDWILSFGLLSPLIYILFCLFRPLIFFPYLILSVAGGLAFGAIYGTLLTVVGGVSAAALSFWIGRRYGKYLPLQKYEKTQRLRQKIADKGLFYVLILRIMPFLNFDLVSYASGVSNVHFKSYFWGTCIGMLPGTILMNYFGSTLVTGNPKQMILTVSAIILLVLSSFLFQKWMKRRMKFEIDE